jgi:hypothetical protein
MSRHLAHILAVLALLLTGAAQGAEGVAPDDLRAGGTNAWGEQGRLELRGAFALHDQVVSAGADRTSATGSAISHVSAGGAWMAARLPLGATANLAVDRFALRPAGGAPDSRAVTGFETTVGLLARLGGRDAAAALEGQLGYGFARVPILTPVAAMPMSPVPGANLATLQAHGPALAARVTVAIGRDVDLEASGRALPLLFGARAAGGSVDLRRFGGGAGARIGMLGAGPVRLSALVGYEADVIDGDGAAAVHQGQHRIGLGLRAGLAQAQPAAASKPVAAAAPPPTAPPPSVRVVRGVVQTASDEESPPPALADVAVTVAGGPETITGADGSFRIEGLAHGLAQFRFSREGFEDRSEVVSVPAEGEVVLAIRLRPVAAARSAALIGQVRTEDGAPVAAQVRVLELGLAARADQAGRFRFDVPPGRYSLTIEAAGFVSQRKSAPVGAGEQNIFNVELQRQR